MAVRQKSTNTPNVFPRQYFRLLQTSSALLLLLGLRALTRKTLSTYIYWLDLWALSLWFLLYNSVLVTCCKSVASFPGSLPALEFVRIHLTFESAGSKVKRIRTHVQGELDGLGTRLAKVHMTVCHQFFCCRQSVRGINVPRLPLLQNIALELMRIHLF